jgi:hypothetical protein
MTHQITLAGSVNCRRFLFSRSAPDWRDVREPSAGRCRQGKKMVVGCHLSAFGVPAAELFVSRCKSACFISEAFKPETGHPCPEL